MVFCSCGSLSPRTSAFPAALQRWDATDGDARRSSAMHSTILPYCRTRASIPTFLYGAYPHAAVSLNIAYDA